MKRATREAAKKPARVTTATKRKRRNPEDAEALAAAVSESFHGRPAQSVRDVEETVARRAVLADLGRMIELGVWTDEDRFIKLTFPRGVRCACSPEKDDQGKPFSRSLYFVGGDQSLDLAELGIEGAMVKDHVRIGDCQTIAYHTSKVFHNFEPNDYEHQFGEESNNLPTLNYDTLNQRVFLVGGSYEVRPEGIVD